MASSRVIVQVPASWRRVASRELALNSTGPALIGRCRGDAVHAVKNTQMTTVEMVIRILRFKAWRHHHRYAKPAMR